MNDADMLDEFKMHAFEHAKNFSIENIYPIYEQLYIDLLGSKNV